MLVTVDQALGAQPLAQLRAALHGGEDAWVDGRATAGHRGAPVKFNHQIDEQSDVAARCQAIVLEALERHSLFVSAALPCAVYPPMFNRYGVGMAFGAHIDGGVRIDPRTGRRLRTDISATLFLSDPGDYDGGELEIADTYGTHSVKLNAGDLLLYPATSLHRVTPITRGERLACFFWVQSLVRDDGQRTLLLEMDTAIQTLGRTGADEGARTALAGCYHNLLRQWAQT
jgi:PKHD-type hydroxylase